MHQELSRAKSDIEINQRWAYEDARRIRRHFEPHWDLVGQRVLNVGVGLGGKLPYYLAAGPSHLVGIDIGASSIAVAQEHIRSLDLEHGTGGKIALLAADAACLPFCPESFDAIVSINTFEHIQHLEQALQECERVLRPGGLAFLHLPPYYSPWGPHLEDWIHFPWPHLLFSDQTLMRVAAREDARLQLNQQFVNAAQVDWAANQEQIPGLNRVTLGQFRALVSRTGLTTLQLKLLPFGYHALDSGSTPKRLALALLKRLTRIPLLQEAVVTKMTFVLKKGP
jgi:SAM-dependent methyltransferase